MSQVLLRQALRHYVLGCIGHLPAGLDRQMSWRILKTHLDSADWKSEFARRLKLDASLEERLRQMWIARQAEAARTGSTADPEEFATRTLDDPGFAHLLPPPPPLVPPTPPWGDAITVKSVGFWRDNEGTFPQFPQVQKFVRPGWYAAELPGIIAYLRAGHNAHPDFAFCGWSTCRFLGCAEGENNGSRELTDGEWGWPEGLAHYVERHAVTLPEEFIATMRANHWRPPTPTDPPPRTILDPAFWIAWAAK